MADFSKIDIDNDSYNVKDVTARNPSFSQASTRTNIASGESLSSLFGKIKKWFADLKTVAFSGSYNDLSDQPTIPTVNNGTLTIQKNGTNVKTFTANQNSNTTANITCANKPNILNGNTGTIAVPAQSFKEVSSLTVPTCQCAIITGSIEHTANGNALSVNIGTVQNGDNVVSQADYGNRAFSVNTANVTFILTNVSTNTPVYMNVWSESAINVTVKSLRAVYF